jgi:DNA-binding winged helix-turn-helix (wHTH) protein
MISGNYEFDGFVIDTQRRGVWRRDGTPLRLTPRLFRTLLLFVERPGELLEKDWLMSRLWPGMDVGENSLSQIVCNLRQALAEDGRRFIQTESRYGFRFICPVRTLPQTDDSPAAEPADLETLSLVLAMQEIVTRHLAEALAQHLPHAARRKLARAAWDESGGRAPSRTPAFPS